MCFTWATGRWCPLRTCVDDGGAGLRQLLCRLRAERTGTFRFPKVHPAEISKESMEALGFRRAGGHRLYAAKARSELGNVESPAYHNEQTRDARWYSDSWNRLGD